MLIDFRFKNYKCFRDEQVLSLVANNKDKQLRERLIATEALKNVYLLPSAVIYGANAAGKTTVLDALAFCRRIVLTSAKYDPHQPIPVTPFLLDDSSAKQPSEFEFTLLLNGVRYQYGFACDRERIHEEWLISFPKGRARRLFHRKADKRAKGKEYSFSAYFKGEKDKIASVTAQNSLFLSMGASIFRQPDLVQVYEWFAKQMHGIKARHLDPAMFIDLATNDTYLAAVRRMIRAADLGITDISVHAQDITAEDENLPGDMPPEIKNLLISFRKVMQESVNDDTPLKELKINTQHRKNDGSPVPFRLGEESAGTQQYFTLSFPILSALQNGHMLFVDELNNSLHPLLTRKIISLFHDPAINTKGAQLIFNTHDVTLLTLSLFRRDQIWFVEKDKHEASHLYSLNEFSPRKDESLAKGYLQGRYGAIPFFNFVAEEIFGND